MATKAKKPAPVKTATKKPAPITAASAKAAGDAMLAPFKKEAADTKTRLAEAKAYQAEVIADNTTLAGTEGGTINPLTGHITLGDTGPVFPDKPLTGGDVPVTPGGTVTSGTQAVLEWLTSIGMNNPNLASLVRSWGGLSYSTDYQISLLRQHPVYLARFPAMAGLQKNDPTFKEGDYFAKETADRQLLYTYLGDSAKNYDNPAQLGKLMTDFVSTKEFQDRLSAIHDEVNGSPDTKAWLKSTYGYSDHDLAAAWLDPKLAGDTIAKRQAASQIGGAGVTAGFGQLTQAQAELLASQGVTQSQAQNTFAKVGNYGQLEQGLPGSDAGVSSQQGILDASFNGGVAGAKLKQVQDSRLAPFQANGGAVADSSGVGGMRSAATP